MLALEWLEQAAGVMNRIKETQLENIKRAAAPMVESIAAGRWVHTFGYGHATIPVEEMYPRIGGFVGFHMTGTTRRNLLRTAAAWACLAAGPRLSVLADDEPTIAEGCAIVEDAIRRGPTADRRLALVFTGHEFAEGGETILDQLAKHRARGSFFLTGDFLANPGLGPLVKRIVAEGHYLGPHSDKHLLYCEWAPPKKRLVSRDQFDADLSANLDKIARFTPDRPVYFLPPYEHADAEIASWTSARGLRLVNFTSGTRSNADYAEDDAPNFVPSREILAGILRRESEDAHGLNGFLLLLHIGAGPRRTDKFANHFGELLDRLAGRGYRFVRVDEMLDPKRAR